MKADLTELACVIDRSGSMQSIQSDAIGGFNSFLASQQQLDGEARLTLVLFDNLYEVPYRGVDVRQVPPLDQTTFVPRGTTALHDAIGRTIDDLGARLAGLPEEQRPGHVIVVILTDGIENASTDYSASRIAEMISHQRTKYGWEFVFLAANQDAVQTAAALAIPAQDAVNFAATPAGMQVACSAMSDDVSRRRSSAPLSPKSLPDTS